MDFMKYKLKELPLEAKWRQHFEVVILDEIPTLPLDQPDIWWTAAATVEPSIYEGQDKKDGTKKWIPKGSRTDWSFQPSKRVGSPTRQLRWKWPKLKGTKKPQHPSIDELSASEIKISHQQMWHPLEQSELTTTNAQRRMRNMASNFERRYFTNDPNKVGTHSGKLLISAKT